VQSIINSIVQFFGTQVPASYAPKLVLGFAGIFAAMMILYFATENKRKN
jgi:hypothetical protein